MPASRVISVAEQFGMRLADGDYAAARALLTDEVQRSHSPEVLKSAVDRMTAYDPGPICDVKVMSESILDDWPAKQQGDLAVVYVALTGEGFCEAVTLTIAEQAEDIRIRGLEWGRP